MRRRRGLAMGDTGTGRTYRLLGIALVCVTIWPLAAHGTPDTWTGLGLTDNWSDPANWLDGSPPLFTDSALFNASDSGHTSILDAAFFALNPTGELLGLQYTGNATHTTDLAGTSNLKINGPVYIGYGGATDGANVTWTGTGSIQIGDPLSLTTFHMGTNTSASTVSNTGSLALNGPVVDAYANDLSIGRKVNSTGYGTVNGSLILGSNSSLHVGTLDAPGVVNIEMNQSTTASVATPTSGGAGTGLLDVTQGDIEFHLSELNVGRHTGYFGTTTGTFTMGDGSVVTATTANVGTTSGVLEIELFGTTAGTEYDQVQVFGEVDLDGDGLGGGTLDLILKFAPSVGDTFVIVQNDGTDPIAGHFWGLPEATQFTEWYMDTEYAFWISYLGLTGTDNDVVLWTEKIIPPKYVPAPGAVLLAGIGVGIVSRLRRRRLL